MRKHLGLLVAGAAALAMVLGVGPATQSARAEYFGYTGTIHVDIPSGWSITGGAQDSPTVTLTSPGGNQLTFFTDSVTGPPHLGALDGGTGIVLGGSAVTPNTTTGSTSPEPVSVMFTYTLNLTDYAALNDTTPVGTGSLELSALMTGTITGGRNQANLEVKGFATMPANGEVMIGNTKYTIAWGNATPPGPGNPGAFGTHVEARAIPEPVSLISTALGFLGVGGFLARNRRRNRKALAA